MHRFDDARKELGDELARYPRNEEALTLSAAVHHEQGNTAEEAVVCRKYLAAFEKVNHDSLSKNKKDFMKDHPNAGLPSYLLGLYAKDRGQWDEAVEKFLTAFLFGYDPLECRLQLMDVEFGRKDWVAAFQIAKETSDPNGKENAELRVLQAFAFHELRDEESAGEMLRLAVRSNPFESWTAKNLAVFLLHRNEPQLAEPVLRRFVRLYPEDLQAKELWDMAVKGRCLSLEAAMNPVSKEFLNQRRLKFRHVFHEKTDILVMKVNETVMELIKSGSLSEAAGWLEKFLEIYDLSPSLNYNMAQLFNSLKMFRKSARYAWRARELDEKNRDVHDLIGGIFFQIADFPNSVRFYEESVRLDPADPLGYYNLGCAHRELNDLDKAVENWLLAIKYENLALGSADKPAAADPLKQSVRIKVEPVSFRSYLMSGSVYAS